MLSRREFLLATAAMAGPRPLQPVKYLLLDDRVVEDSTGARLSLGTVIKEPAPLFGEDKPWEPRFDNLYANVMYDEEERLYKCWYSPFIIDPTTTGTARDKRGSVKWAEAAQDQLEMGICYATSKDGLAWAKPDLGIVEFQGSRSNNLILRADPQMGEPHGAGIGKDVREPNPARRYKMLFNRFLRSVPRSDPRSRWMSVGFSPDGIHWSDFRACAEINAPGDTHSNWFWDATYNRYVGITRVFVEGQRAVARTEAPDFLNWTEAEVILRALSSEPERQTYAMAAFPYSGVYLGLLMMINKNGQNDTVDCELAWSADTVHWDRVCPGSSIIPRGPDRSFDSKCLFGACRPIVGSDEIRMYYGGSNGEHSDFRDGFFCLARLRLDGFAAMEPERADTPATVLTAAIPLTGEVLRANVKAPNGAIKAAVLDANGDPVAESESFTGDALDGPLPWHDASGLKDLLGKPVRIRFELKNARLFAFRFAESRG